MLQRLLIANRGEIACRIARTARSMGITSIAVYSDADRDARHVRVCDEAFHLGPSPASQSYLNIGRLLETARRARADAIHPGYGFLSENADFAQACVGAGFIFVGPTASAIRAMGSKSAAKAAMAEAGVPVAPGYHGADQSPERLLAEAVKAGFPLIVKASAGGGGKGMQVVESAADVPQAIESAQRLASAAFGDNRLLLERYFRIARHVEVQVFADSSGTAMTLFDRDCSIQRRHQKVLEEAPAPGLRPEVRAAMSEASIKVARAVGYVGAGTIEFLMDAEQGFYFMEMNTRLQVEHPVTEMITGIDLVEWQLRVARGEMLDQFAQVPQVRGAAVEVRLYAEDPSNNYLPSVGRLAHARWPEGDADLRCDMGVDTGDEISSFYDPMLGKLIAWGKTRLEAVERLSRAVANVEIVGVKTNRALLASVLSDAEFKAGNLATNFLEQRKDVIALADPTPSALELLLMGIWCATAEPARSGGASPWDDRKGWRLAGASRSVWEFDLGSVELSLNEGGDFAARARSSDLAGQLLRRTGDAGSGELQIQVDRQVLKARIADAGGRLQVLCAGRSVGARLLSTEDALQSANVAALGSLTTPLPGTVVAVHVKPGEAIKQGAALVTVEAMKMEHTLTAPRDGTVVRIAFKVTERVAEGAVLVELE
jgi:3-methylcrotonyl-CoA carboxylase alpha subunit